MCCALRGLRVCEADRADFLQRRLLGASSDRATPRAGIRPESSAENLFFLRFAEMRASRRVATKTDNYPINIEKITVRGIDRRNQPLLNENHCHFHFLLLNQCDAAERRTAKEFRWACGWHKSREQPPLQTGEAEAVSSDRTSNHRASKPREQSRLPATRIRGMFSHLLSGMVVATLCAVSPVAAEEPPSNEELFEL